MAKIRELVDRGLVALKRSIEVIDFTDEEGRFGGMVGSMCIAGKPPDILSMRSADSGERMATLLARHGSDPRVDEDGAKDLALRCKYESVYAFLELHIEQGPVLDASNESIGVVTGICGLWKAEYTLRGRANHAGTTPMKLRRNAFEGCARVQVEIPNILRRHGTAHTVCTIGSVKVFPGSPNVVPETCAFTVEIRDERQDTIDAVRSAVRSILRQSAQRHGLDVKERIMSRMSPVRADSHLVAQVRKHCARQVFGTERPSDAVRLMPSGALHDAAQMAALGPMAMIFVPSIGGISHHHEESTDATALEHGCNALLNALLDLATNDLPSPPSSSSSPERVASISNRTAVRSDTALVCIDLQEMPPTTNRKGVDFTPEDVAEFNRNVPRLLGRVRAAQGAARRANLEVIHCRIESRTMDGRDRTSLHKRMNIHVAPGRAEWMKGVEPVGDELVFSKTGSNAFCCTALDHVLRNMNVKRLVFCGVLTDECVAGTVKSACDLGYDCTVLEDACLAATPSRHHHAVRTISRFANLICSVSEWMTSLEKNGNRLYNIKSSL